MKEKCKIETYRVADAEEFVGKKRLSHGSFSSEEGKIELTYEDYLFVGKEIGYGHWICEDQLKNFKGSMSLHKTPGSKILEGYSEGSQSGGEIFKSFIRIIL